VSFLFTLDETKLGEQLPEIFEAAELEIRKAEPLFELDGERLELLARNVPQHQAHYALLAQEQKQLMKWLENQKAKLEAIHLKNYSRGQRALSTTDQKILMGGEQNIVEINQLIIAAAELYGKLEQITEAFKQMGWMVGHITKLRVAELHEVIL
jgi:type IV secretory pathway TrbD component